MEAGWSPTAAVTARLAGGALAMAVFATVVTPAGSGRRCTHARTVVAYGLVPIAGAQLFYYNAVAHLSVGVALLLEYTAPILVVGWLWATTRQRPTTLTLGGVVLAVAGIMLVLGRRSGSRRRHINLVGVGWALAAAVCAACYFLMSDKVGGPTDERRCTRSRWPPAAWSSAPPRSACSALRGDAADLHRQRHRDRRADHVMVVPVVALALMPTAIAYTLGIVGVARLRPRFASLVGLAEVMFAVLCGLGAARRGCHRDAGARWCRGAGGAGAGPPGRPQRAARRDRRRRHQRGDHRALAA